MVAMGIVAFILPQFSTAYLGTLANRHLVLEASHEHADGTPLLGLGSAPTRYETAAFTSATIFFSTAGVHSVSAYDVGQIGPSSRLAASSNPSVA
jgi:hypothetical protein